jgi:hypothetical protein
MKNGSTRFVLGLIPTLGRFFTLFPLAEREPERGGFWEKVEAQNSMD